MDEEKLNIGLYLIALADEGASTKAISIAIEELKSLKHARENLPF